MASLGQTELMHDDVIKWKHFPRYWPFVRGIRRPPVNSSHYDVTVTSLMLCDGILLITVGFPSPWASYEENVPMS